MLTRRAEAQAIKGKFGPKSKKNKEDDLHGDDSVSGYGPNVASSTVGESLPIACERCVGFCPFFSSRAGAFGWETRLVQAGPHLRCTDSCLMTISMQQLKEYL